MKTAILISGGGSNMAALLDAMAAGRVHAEPVVVIANNPDAGGLQKAQERGVPTRVIDHRAFGDKDAFETALIDALEAAGAELICLAGFMRILSERVVQRWEGRILNIHPSLLPAFKGLNTHARALAAGCSVHGVSVHLVTAALDDGPIIGQAVVPIEDGDSPETLAARVLKMEHQLYPAALDQFVTGKKSKLHMGLATDEKPAPKP